MEKERLRRIALDEARQALGLTDEYGLKFEQRGSIEEWEEGICKNLFEISFRVWEPVALVDLELDAQTGDVLSWRDEAKIREPGEGILTREEAIRIARAGVEVPENADIPEIRNTTEDGRIMTLVTWRFRTALTGKLEALEVMIHPGTRRICGVRRF